MLERLKFLLDKLNLMAYNKNTKSGAADRRLRPRE